jgi:hypothetical protein
MGSTTASAINPEIRIIANSTPSAAGSLRHLEI